MYYDLWYHLSSDIFFFSTFNRHHKEMHATKQWQETDTKS